jgi:hypothetical protein
MLRTHGKPKLSLALDDIKEDCRLDGFVIETHISLLSNRSTKKHDERDHCLTLQGFLASNFTPPRLDGEVCRPLMGVDKMEPKPLLDHAPKSLGIPTL